ncbi:MAG: hypothetical protein V4480_00115 [Patescibacteria group bacterium]
MIEAIPQPQKEENASLPSLGTVEQLLSEELRGAEQDLAIIGESLRAFARLVEAERPDVLVFLDVSVRIFGTPYLKYFSERMGRGAPSIRFYNDHNLKGAFLGYTPLDPIVQNDFESLKGKKVFFVDETFSEGKGALALLEASSRAGIAARYIALTKDPEPPSSKILNEEDEILVEQDIEDGNIIIYDHPIHNLFSRYGSRLYVKEEVEGKTRPMQVSREKATAASSIPHADSYSVPPEGMSSEEYQLAVSAKFDASVRDLKEKIYQTLKAEEGV